MGPVPAITQQRPCVARAADATRQIQTATVRYHARTSNTRDPSCAVCSACCFCCSPCRPSPPGLLENRPSATLGSITNSADFLPVREAFQFSLVEGTPQSIKLRFVATDGYYLYRHRFQFRAEPAEWPWRRATAPRANTSTMSTSVTSRSITACSTSNCHAPIHARSPWR